MAEKEEKTLIEKVSDIAEGIGGVIEKFDDSNDEFEDEMMDADSFLEKIIAFVKRFKKAILIVLAILIGAIVLSVVFAKDKEITTIAEASLKEVIETSELSTVEFIYNSTTSVKNDKGKVKYHIAYEGTVKAGFDFNEIKIEKDDKNKKIVVIIPPIKKNAVNINDKTFDFIFMKDKYDTETTFQEAYKASYNDLENKAKSNENIKKMAYDNAVDSMRAILMPLEKKLPAGYEFDFREGGEAE